MISKLITLIKYCIPLTLSNNYKNSNNFLNPTLKFCFPTIFTGNLLIDIREAKIDKDFGYAWNG